MNKIRDEMGLTALFITHDLCVAAQICDTLVVMEQGQIVERGTVDEVFGNSSHYNYTRKFLDAQPGKGWNVPDISKLPLIPNGAPL